MSTETKEKKNPIEIEMVNISQLREAEYNPRDTSEKEFQDIKNSIEEFGVVDPLIVNRFKGRDNVIIGGHQRVKVLKSMGVEKVPVVYVTLPLEKERRLNIRLNKNTGHFDYDKILEEFGMEELFDLGFEEDDFPDLEMLEPEETEGDDEIPEQVQSITVKGDLYELGDNRVMCGDSTMVNEVDKLMEGAKSELCFTDPPYGVSYQSNMRSKSDKFEKIKNDDHFITEWIPNIGIYNDGFVFIWTSWKVVNKWIEITSDLGYPTNMIIWDKGGGGIGDLEKTFSSDYEIGLVWHNGKKIVGKRLGSVWECGKDNPSDYQHPTQKPVELSEIAIMSVTQREDKVLDLFLGSGTTLIACEKTNRKCYGMELDEKYCDVIVKRYVDFCKKNNRPYSVKRNGQKCEEFG